MAKASAVVGEALPHKNKSGRSYVQVAERHCDVVSLPKRTFKSESYHWPARLYWGNKTGAFGPRRSGEGHKQGLERAL